MWSLPWLKQRATAGNDDPRQSRAAAKHVQSNEQQWHSSSTLAPLNSPTAGVAHCCPGRSSANDATRIRQVWSLLWARDLAFHGVNVQGHTREKLVVEPEQADAKLSSGRPRCTMYNAMPRRKGILQYPTVTKVLGKQSGHGLWNLVRCLLSSCTSISWLLKSFSSFLIMALSCGVSRVQGLSARLS